MANKRLIETYHRNGRNYLRLNLKRVEPIQTKPTPAVKPDRIPEHPKTDDKPTPVLKAGWKLPEYPETKCQYCEKLVRPQAYNDCGHIYLSIGCCDSLIEDIPWPFTEDYIHNAKEHLEALGFEYSWW